MAYVADSGNKAIRKLNVSSGYVSTLVRMTSRTLTGIAVHSNGIVYATDSVNHVILEITPMGNFTVLAGTLAGGIQARGYSDN